MATPEMIVHIEPGDVDEQRDLDLAKAIGQALEKAYPNHPWLISFAGHNLMVRHLSIAAAWSVATGMDGACSLLPRNKIGTVQEATKTAVHHAGELLERFGLPRGPWDGTEPKVPEDLRQKALSGRTHRGWAR